MLKWKRLHNRQSSGIYARAEAWFVRALSSIQAVIGRNEVTRRTVERIEQSFLISHHFYIEEDGEALAVSWSAKLWILEKNIIFYNILLYIEKKIVSLHIQKRWYNCHCLAAMAY